MTSYNEATSRFGCKSSVVQKNSWVKGKENGVNVPPNTQKQTSEKSQDPPKSRLPLLSKTKEPIDFQKLHQSWQNQFQKGKALKKKQCTRPQPFNFSQKRDRSGATTDTGQCENPQASHRRREPLTEVTFGQKNPESKDTGVKGGSEEFKADPMALASILSNVGVPIAATGKLSLAQRVPVRVSSIAPPSNVYKNTMVRSSMYAVLRSQSASTNLDRMSCFSKMQNKVSDQQSVLKQNILLKSHVPVRSIKELSASSQDKPQSQENPVLQQMNRTAQAPSVTSLPLSSQITSVKPHPAIEDGESAALQADGWEKNTLEVDPSTGKMDPMKKTGAASVEFFADSQALASILSNTGVNIGNCGKLSLAQRVPVQGRNVSVKSITTSTVPIATQPSTPKSCFGRMSTVAVPLKDIVFSPCRVPKTMMTMEKSSSGSAKRVNPSPASAMKFSQPHSTRSKPMFFPKTPRALALEMANKKLEDDCSDTQPSARSTVKWADERSPSASETLCENEPKIEQVAVRLFIDAECPGETDLKKNLAEESDCLQGSESLTTSVQERVGAILPKDSVNKAAGVSQYSIHTDTDPPAPLSSAHTADPPAPLSSAHTADPPVQCPSIVSSLRTSFPLSFLSHPAVQALQLCTLGPYSLPDIARLRIQAAVSAKQRFWETCLDEECAFYTSRGAISSYRGCIDPVSSLLERQEDLHFTPILPGEP